MARTRGLVERVRQAAAREGRSLNEYLTRLARAATDPDLAGSDAARLRERLERAGLAHAARLVAVHGPRAYEGVQLASGCAADAAVSEGVAFAAFDKTLRGTAATEGLDLLPE